MRNLCAIYLRKSRADVELENLGEMETLARHESILKEVARKQGLRVGKIYKEIVSGESIAERPEMQRLLEDVNERKWKGVLVVEVERLARGDTMDQGRVSECFKYSETLIITPSKTYNPNNESDEEYFEFGLFMSRREYKTIRRRLEAGKLQSVKDGNYISSAPPFGYDIDKRNRKDRTLKINENAKYVKMVFDWFVNEKVGCGKIAERLTALGIPTNSGKNEWSRSTVNKMLKNEIYIGKLPYKKRKVVKRFKGEKVVKGRNYTGDYDLHDGKHEAIIDIETFETAQSLFKKRHNAPVRNHLEINNAFSGLVYCSKCGLHMQYKKSIQGRTSRIYHTEHRKCKMKSCPYNQFLEAVIQSLKMHIEDFQVKMKGNNENVELKKHQELITSLEDELQKLQNQRTKLFDYFEREIYSEDDFLLRKQNIDEKIDLINFNLKEELEKEIKEVNYDELIVTFNHVITSLTNENIPAKVKNDLLKGIIKRIDYTSYDLGTNKGASIELDIYLN